jgi:hypothetical protein
MEFIINLDSINGKTVKSATFIDGNELIAILFTDNTCMFVDVRHFGSSYELELINAPDARLQRDAGVITNEEYHTQMDAIMEFNDGARKQRELRELERLTKKYKGGD